MSVDTKRARDLARYGVVGHDDEACCLLSTLADEVERLREDAWELEALRRNAAEWKELAEAMSERTRTKWEPLLAVAKEHKCECDQDAPPMCHGRVCCELVHVISACEEKP